MKKSKFLLTISIVLVTGSARSIDFAMKKYLETAISREVGQPVSIDTDDLAQKARVFLAGATVGALHGLATKSIEANKGRFSIAHSGGTLSIGVPEPLLHLGVLSGAHALRVATIPGTQTEVNGLISQCGHVIAQGFVEGTSVEQNGAIKFNFSAVPAILLGLWHAGWVGYDQLKKTNLNQELRKP